MIAFVDCAVAAAEAHTHRPQAAAVRCIQRSESSLAKSNEGWHTSSRLLLLLNQTHMSAHTLQYVHDTTRHDTTQQSSLPNPNQSQALATTTERPTSLRTWGSWMPCDFCETLEPCVISFWGCGPCVHTHTHGMMHMRGCAALKMQPPYPQILPYTRTGSRAGQWRPAHRGDRAVVHPHWQRSLRACCCCLSMPLWHSPDQTCHAVSTAGSCACA